MTQQESYAPAVAGMFGYVTPEDQSSWMQSRQKRAKEVSVLRAAISGFSSGFAQFNQKNLDAQLRAVHQAEQGRRSAEDYEETTTTRKDKETGQTHTSTEYERRDREKGGDATFEMG